MKRNDKTLTLAEPIGRPQSELKYTIPQERTKIALSLLSTRLDPDPQYPSAIISSIYFDSYDWKLLGEKRNSDYLKTKVRLRWYASITENQKSFDETTFAEVKYKIGSKRTKIRHRTHFSGQELENMSLSSFELLEVIHKLKRLGCPIRRALVPTFVVSYKRQRFVDRATGKRVCIDSDIGVPKFNKATLTSSFSSYLPNTVIEVKSPDQEFPLFLRPLQALGLRKTAFSKYYECYAELTNSVF
jgi:hypothetical protein